MVKRTLMKNLNRKIKKFGIIQKEVVDGGYGNLI
jgi:hypothetical protein